jgi:hypothetical protein
MNNLVFIDDPNNQYIHQITKKMESMNIDENYDEKCDKFVLSIDIGIVNLGISVGIIDEDFNLKEITYVDLINITQFTHEHELEGIECKLLHTKSIADWMEHIFHEHLPLFQQSDYILVERQPPCGLVAIEQLIYYRWREKTILVHPRSMHKYYNIGSYDYEQRKEETMNIATRSYSWHTRAIDRYESFERKHDISDSICLMGFWLNKKKQKYIEKKNKERLKKIQLTNTGMNTDEWFEQYRYFPIKII